MMNKFKSLNFLFIPYKLPMFILKARLLYRHFKFLMLSFLILLPLFGVLVLSLTSKTNVNFIRNFSLFWAFVVFNVSLLLLFSFDLTYGGFQFIERFDWLVLSNNTVILGIDGIALFMIILTTFLILYVHYFREVLQLNQI